ncbi:MAG: hypothetical protein AAF569_09160 [Pseudomonadota bacterium]
MSVINKLIEFRILISEVHLNDCAKGRDLHRILHNLSLEQMFEAKALRLQQVLLEVQKATLQNQDMSDKKQKLIDILDEFIADEAEGGIQKTNLQSADQ